MLDTHCTLHQASGSQSLTRPLPLPGHINLFFCVAPSFGPRVTLVDTENATCRGRLTSCGAISACRIVRQLSHLVRVTKHGHGNEVPERCAARRIDFARKLTISAVLRLGRLIRPHSSLRGTLQSCEDARPTISGALKSTSSRFHDGVLDKRRVGKEEVLDLMRTGSRGHAVIINWIDVVRISRRAPLPQ